jgi:ketosteroid isomerase-like protein
MFLGCASSGSGPQGSISAQEVLVRSLDDQERRAALNRDIDALERLWSADFTVNAPNNRVLVGRNEVMALLHQGVINFSSFERAVEFVRIVDGIAIVMGAETVKPIESAPFAGKTVQRRFTNIWRREAGTWRLYARHANNIEVR